MLVENMEDDSPDFSSSSAVTVSELGARVEVLLSTGDRVVVELGGAPVVDDFCTGEGVVSSSRDMSKMEVWWIPSLRPNHNTKRHRGTAFY